MKRILYRGGMGWLVLGLLIVGLNANVTFAQDQAYIDQVNRLLGLAESKANELGFRRTHNNKIDKVILGNTDTITIDLDAGKDYMIVGVCDQDCSDMDFRLLDPNNRQVAIDVEDDDLPIVEASPPRNGTYRLEIKMVKCSDSPCYYGVGVYAKTGAGSGSGSGSGGSTSPSNGEGDRPWRIQVENQLKERERSMDKILGLKKTHDYYIDRLRQGNKDSITVNLRAGMSYAIVGVCDNDCGDIDIKVFDSRGRQIAADTSVNDAPAVIVNSLQNGEYKIEVSMERCTVNPCLYGIGIFGK